MPVPRALIDDFLAQKSLALVGVSRDGRKGFGNALRKELAAQGYVLHVVHPEADGIADQPCARALAEVAADVGGVVLVTPPAETEKLVREAAALYVDFVCAPRAFVANVPPARAPRYPPRPMANVAFLGTGLIGSGLAEVAAKRGDRVTAWNRLPEKARALESHGVRVAATAEEAARGADRVHLALTDDAAVDAVLEACKDALRSALVVDHSTTSPAGTAARAKRLAARGVRFLHMPVFMSPAMCREASGIMLCAGVRAVFDAAAPELRAMTGKVSVRASSLRRRARTRGS
jgi:prephenate dehydrogenase